ncbi:MAG: DUF2284 domain-containing protein [Oscillospiraceae bacterium]
MNKNDIIRLARDKGFSETAELDVSTIELMPEVREMCATNTCHQYGKNWACPPGCGEIEDCKRKIGQYAQGVLVQTVGQLEDSWDFEEMKETEQRHKKMFNELIEEISASGLDMLPVGAGTCTRCKECTYPQSPCRFPDKAMSSMEAYGMLVNQICKSNGVPYNHGTNTVCYTSCILLNSDK